MALGLKRSESGFCLLGPVLHAHLLVQSERLHKMLARLCRIAERGMQLTQAKMAMGKQRTHAQLLSQTFSSKICGSTLLRLSMPQFFYTFGTEVQRPRFGTAFLTAACK